MRRSVFLSSFVALVGALPALADDVTVLRGVSAPPPPAPAPPTVVVQTVVYPGIVYAPAYYPAYTLYPGYFIQPQHMTRHRQSTPVQPAFTGPLRPVLR